MMFWLLHPLEKQNRLSREKAIHLVEITIGRVRKLLISKIYETVTMDYKVLQTNQPLL